MPHHSIALVSAYFGEWPSYINIFLESCRRNPSVDFLLLSDCGPLPKKPSNVHIIPMTLEDIRNRARGRLGIEPAIETPYHMCDFKPTYGVLFEDHLSDYDFWGGTDLDLVYGQIREFVTAGLLSSHDIIAARPWYLTGFFFLFRNVGRVNRLFELSQDYPGVLETSTHYSFCECNQAYWSLRRGKSIFEVETSIESMTEVIRREEKNGNLNVYFDELARESIGEDPIFWDNGKLLENGEEYLLLHFVGVKDKFYFAFPRWEEVPDRFYITRTGFYRPKERLGLRHLAAMRKGEILQQGILAFAEKAANRLYWPFDLGKES